MRRKVAVALLGALLLSSQPAVRAQGTKTYKARLSPVPVAAYTATVTGSGSVTATLIGTKLSIAGTFQGLNTPATVARIHKSPRPGIRGPVLFDLTVSNSTNGTIGGAFDLTAAQVQELAQARYYVQLHSEKAPDGNLWGWLLSQENRR